MESIQQNKFLISLVVPIYNEEDTINTFYNAVKIILDEVTTSYEIIFVNDGSTDQSLVRLVDLRTSDSSVKIIDFSRNFGKEAALTAGIDHSLGDAVIPIDVDLQDPPELIPKMIEHWCNDGADVVFAQRICRRDDTFLKRFTANFFYKVLSLVTNTEIPQNVGDYRLMDRAVVDQLKCLKERRRFMKGLFAWVGYKSIAVPYKRKKRSGGESKFSFWKLFNFAVEGITSFSIAPLQFATYFGVLVSILSFLYALFIVIKTLLWGVDVPGYASLIVAILFLGGVQLVAIGVLGEYIGRIYDEVKNRPVYITRKFYD